MKFIRLACIVLFSASCAAAQEVVYVTVDNLVLRDRPEKKYNVFAILHPHCPLKIEHTDRGYLNDKAVAKRFYQVSISYRDEEGNGHLTGGWVEKKYVTDRVPAGNEAASGNLFTAVATDGDPKHFNAAKYPPPKYRGAEKQAPPFKKIYRPGPRGGCYYLNQKGRKVYVDKSFCK